MEMKKTNNSTKKPSKESHKSTTNQAEDKASGIGDTAEDL